MYWLHRLHEAKSGLTTAIDVIGAAESRPVVDLTDYRPHVHLGQVSVEMHDGATISGEAGTQDPLVRMVRHAVDRAVVGAAEHAEPDTDAEGDADLVATADPATVADPITTAAPPVEATADPAPSA